ncbi:uncharacterized protein LOC119145950 isoform X2 [Falco rusticolus]|uniref:uncharacterized protein LOC119145950 isoform X2 n=1 Tax=Falco rusticolus TaxID=120794 RepID=UPI0018868BAD|nr:uncharacterized protein LOC119145950 isoform X2 [Falco rusticolus]
MSLLSQRAVTEIHRCHRVKHGVPRCQAPNITVPHPTGSRCLNTGTPACRCSAADGTLSLPCCSTGPASSLNHPAPRGCTSPTPSCPSSTMTRWSCWARTAAPTGADGTGSFLCSWARRVRPGYTWGWDPATAKGTSLWAGHLWGASVPPGSPQPISRCSFLPGSLMDKAKISRGTCWTPAACSRSPAGRDLVQPAGYCQASLMPWAALPGTTRTPRPAPSE